MTPPSLTYEAIPHRQYGFPHGASSPMQAAMLTNKHQAEKQNEAINGIRGGRRTRNTRNTRKRSRTYRRNTRRNRPKPKRTRRRTRSCVCDCIHCRKCPYRKSLVSRKRKPSHKRSYKKSHKGGSKGIPVPHFTESPNPVSPDGSNKVSGGLNSTYNQGKANSEYDHMVNASPKVVDSF